MKWKKAHKKKKHHKLGLTAFEPYLRTTVGSVHKKKKKLRDGDEDDEPNFMQTVASNIGGYLGGHVGAQLGIPELGGHFGRRVGKSAAKTFRYWLRSRKKK